MPSPIKFFRTDPYIRHYNISLIHSYVSIDTLIYYIQTYTQHQTCSRYTEYTDIYMYVYSHAHTDIIHMHIFTYIRESLQIWTHGMCTQRVCSIIFHFQKWRSTVPAEMLHTISYIPTYIHIYLVWINMIFVGMCVIKLTHRWVPEWYSDIG